jgi:glutamate N-acetyltransferase/amino-acid N-acetyltransferase
MSNDTIYPVKGVRIGVVEAGIRKKNRKDLVLFELDRRVCVAGVFTQNRFCAAPVIVAKDHLKTKTPRYFLINTGCANAGMGKQGLQDARASCEALAKLANCEAAQVLPFSTGVIGEPLPVDRLASALPAALSALSADAWFAAAQGIMTTDTFPKVCSRQLKLSGKTVTVTGITKGAGMIKPNMATMLAYVATDANISKPMLKALLKEAVTLSFNRITVDGDTSTNDVAVLVATRQAGNDVIQSREQADYARLRKVLEEVFVNLAQAIIRDAEGATKFMTLKISGGKTSAECLKVAYAVAESPLVKTAFFAADPNWGRIVAAIGRSGINDLDCDKIKIHLNEILIVEKGGRASSYQEADGQRVMKEKEITIAIQLARGKAKETVWTSDLSHDYVKINAEYRS